MHDPDSSSAIKIAAVPVVFGFQSPTVWPVFTKPLPIGGTIRPG